MSIINVSHLTFSYDNSYENIFDDVSFKIDSNWNIGFCGRNGRGKTTLLKLFMNEYKYSGTIDSDVEFTYFPYNISNPQSTTIDIIKNLLPQTELWQIEYELNLLRVSKKCLYRNFCSLSNGEQSKILLATLFLKQNNFPLIDEPTNHLDFHGRNILSSYLKKKSGFIVVSHDRTFIDNCVNHILSINKSSIEVVNGNYSSWNYNKSLRDTYELNQNKQIKQDIKRLTQTAREKAIWSDKIEATKIGTHQGDRGRIGHLAAKMMKRAKCIEHRCELKILEKSKLLKDIEFSEPLKMFPLTYHSNKILSFCDVSVKYNNEMLFESISFSVEQGDRIRLQGINGSGKTSLIKLLLGENVDHLGKIALPNDLIISYIPQDVSFLNGSLQKFMFDKNLNETIFKTILRKLDFPREQFEKDISTYSDGQKKKLLLGASLCNHANIYIWDEPLNYIDIISREQIEAVVLKYAPTMIFVEHDDAFCRKIATKSIKLSPAKKP